MSEQHNDPAARATVSSGLAWERDFGYSRAVRVGDRILVSGTTASTPDGTVGSTAAEQTRFAIEKIERAIDELGGRLEDVVRTRVFIRRLEDWEQIARVHGERFGHIRPANTLVQALLIGDDLLVEVEAEAIVGSAASVG